jgi:ubiquinone/menaquinone biosynthesis C-methylase UbiE
VLKGLPFPDSSGDCIYSSHTFEHFTFEESLKLAKECWRVLKFHGIFRVAVPDLRIAVNEYLASSEPMASHQFIRRLFLSGGLRDLIHPGNHHNQMFDANSLAFLFRQAGFHLPEVKQFGDSAIPDIAEIELESRKHETLYVEALKLPESP